MSTAPAPLALYSTVVPSQWIDYNGHMNVAYYVMAFDQATDAVLDHLGLGEAHRAATNCSAFVVETHINYQHELVVDTPLRVETQLLGHDSKRVQLFHWMYNARSGELAASTEILLVHVDLGSRHACAMPQSILDRLNALAAEHINLPWPLAAGRAIKLARRR
ncbi:thioesterase family protein [Plasticicumulans acidivorans]|uniref:Acyl-CoA thioester hydrolase n=1 Tax=Plasticicumulans acidivorans TaxID=886464 RepID=A0A317MTD7_9GAMM|nr:thioesterase family protein [Plasticicumulans acidivorans]PWV60594.1 acyl-CoA thioester hydrolase [Plasticicumulans acidivorans]